jgi:hypothetical protein
MLPVMSAGRSGLPEPVSRVGTVSISFCSASSSAPSAGRLGVVGMLAGRGQLDLCQGRREQGRRQHCHDNERDQRHDQRSAPLPGVLHSHIRFSLGSPAAARRRVTRFGHICRWIPRFTTPSIAELMTRPLDSVRDR